MVTYGAPHLKFGSGAADEIGYDLSLTRARRILVVTDPGLAETGTPQRVADQMAQFGIKAPRLPDLLTELANPQLTEECASMENGGILC